LGAAIFQTRRKINERTEAEPCLNLVADDEAASGAPEHSLSGKAQTSRGRLAMTRQAVGEISMPVSTRGFIKSARTVPIRFREKSHLTIFLLASAQKLSDKN